MKDFFFFFFISKILCSIDDSYNRVFLVFFLKSVKSTVQRIDNVLKFNDSTYEFELKLTETEGILRVSQIVVL